MKKTIFAFWLTLAIFTLNGQHLYNARQDGHVDSVYFGINLPDAYTGEGVIIGVTDWGFDYTHPTFYDSTRTRYRVLRAWDQFRTGGPAPDGFDYGTEWVGQEQLLNAQCDTANIYGHHYHGTHVAGIAAGSGAGTPYRGVAPDAELIFASFIPEEQAVVDAFQWMYEVAQQEQKRLVINMSWGLFWMDNPDGTGMIGQKMQELSDLGVVFVTSGGNEGDVDFHLGHTFQQDTLRSRFLFPSANGSPNYWGTSITMTNSPGQPFAVSLNWTNQMYQTIQASPFYNTANGDMYEDNYLVNGTDTIVYNIRIVESDASGRPSARLRVKKASGSSWRFGITVVGESGEFHAWNVAELTTGVGNWGGKFMGISALNWTAGDNHHGTGTPANVECAITVAAHASRYQPNDTTWTGGGICSFSSVGPTINGRMKPDISAPGSNVCSAINSYADDSFNYVDTVMFQGRRYGFAKLSGTSMSSPFTTGVAALLLQANPTLTPEDVKGALIHTATQDEFTVAAGPNRFGHGKVNAYQAVLHALYHAGLHHFNCSTDRYTVFPNPAQDQLFISTPNSQGNAIVQLYDLNGRLVRTASLFQGSNRINIHELPEGCYILKIIRGTYTQSEKIIKTR
ncbi:MAG: S8 family peptidase [Bacteroidales bacterium]|nr:S8 family peptidase [Bacteroidales bacterium]